MLKLILNMQNQSLKQDCQSILIKPIALSVSQAKEIYDLEKYSGQIFTCSALAYSSELKLSPQDKEKTRQN